MPFSDEVLALVQLREGPHVSIYMPTARGGAETQQGPIRLRNLLRQARERLREQGVGESETESLLEPMAALVEENPYWQQQLDGLALFAARDFFRELRLPLTVEERVEVKPRFYLKPLMALLSADGHFYVLTLSQNLVRLFEATRESMSELPLEGVPRTLEDVVGADFEPRTLQFHTRAPQQRVSPATGGARRRAMFFGHGENADQDKNELRRFLQRVDEGLMATISDRTTPLIVAAVDYVAAMFHQISTYPNLVPTPVEGNTDHMNAAELHALVWPIMDAFLYQQWEVQAARFRELRGTPGASDDVASVVQASCDGRVDTLFVATDRQAWGRFMPETRQTEQHFVPEPGDRDLTEIAAFAALNSGARVYAARHDELPAAPLAAVMRY